MSKAGPDPAAVLSEQGVSVLALAVCCVIKVICALTSQQSGGLCQYCWCQGVRVAQVSHFPSTASTLPHPSSPRAPSLSIFSTPRQDKVPASYAGFQLKHCHLCMMRAGASVMGRGDIDIDNSTTSIQHHYYEGHQRITQKF